MCNKKESFIFVYASIKGVFRHFKVERPRSLAGTVINEVICVNVASWMSLNFS